MMMMMIKFNKLSAHKFCSMNAEMCIGVERGKNDRDRFGGINCFP